jgi:hypothetical protein
VKTTDGWARETESYGERKENPEEEKPKRGLGPAAGNTVVEAGDSGAE